MQIIKLHFDKTSPLHLGNGREEYSISERILHSDTLYGAITSIWYEYGLLGNEPLRYDFAISSLFPFTMGIDADGKPKPVYFFPKPFLAPAVADTSQEMEAGVAKKYKKVQYYDQSFFNKYITGQPLVEDVNDTSMLHGQYMTRLKIDPNFIHSKVHQRVQVSRQWEDAEPFYMEQLRFEEGSGLFFIIQYDNENNTEQKALVSEALKILGEQGIGTDRNVGYGRFTYEIADTEEVADFTMEKSEYFINLSLFAPEKIEDAKSALRYQLIKRGGWVTHHNYYNHRKKSVYMFSEGSVFHFPSKPTSKMFYKGNSALDLTPDGITHFKVLRVGKSLFLPVKK